MAAGLDPALATLAAVATTFVIGLLVGVIIKRTLKLAVAVVALAIILVATGFLNFAFNEPSTTVIYRVFSQAAPAAAQVGQLVALLPLSSAAFLIGAALGFWKG